MELTSCIDARMDKIYVSGMIVTEIADLPALIADGIVVVKQGLLSSQYLRTGRGDIYSSIIINKKDEEEKGKIIPFDHFSFYKSKFGSYGVLELSVPDEDGFHNLNCLNPEQYQLLIDNVVDYILNIYGIIMITTDLYYKSLEINKTIQLSAPFECYQRPLDLLIYLLPRRLGLHELDYGIDGQKKKICEYKKIYTNHKRDSGKKGITFKIYDKTSQLKDEFNIEVFGKYLRLEITLKSPYKIKEALKTNKVDSVLTETINRYFNDFVNTNINKPYNSHSKKRDIVLRSILKANYSPGSKTWVRDTLLEIADYEIDKKVPLMLDVQELLDQLNCLHLTSKSTRYNIKESFLYCCDNNKERGTIKSFRKNAHSFYKELLTKLSSSR